MIHPRYCVPCRGTGRIIGFGAAHGGPCPGHTSECDDTRCVCPDKQDDQ